MPSPDGSHRLRLLAVDPDLAAGLDAAEQARAAQAVTARSVEIEAGSSVELRGMVSASHVLLLVRGFALQRTLVERRDSAELYGQGELLGSAETDPELLATEGSWRALTPLRIAVIDAEALNGLAAWPPVVQQLLLRATRRSSRVSLVRAILALPGIDVRVLAYLWHLASRWGRTSHDGVVLDVPLSHETLAELLGARRPTITTAVGRLRRTGLVSPVPGGWRLSTEIVGGVAEQLPSGLRWEVLSRQMPPGPHDRHGAGHADRLALMARLASQRERIAEAQATHARSLQVMRERTAALREGTRSRTASARAASESRAAAAAQESHAARERDDGE